MPDNDPGLFSSRSFRYLQENLRKAGPAMAAGYTLVAALVLLGGAGYAVDRWQGTAPWGILVGLVAGIVVGFYELSRVVWPR